MRIHRPTQVAHAGVVRRREGVAEDQGWVVLKMGVSRNCPLIFGFGVTDNIAP